MLAAFTTVGPWSDKVQRCSTQSWFWIKMALVIILIGYHHVCGAFVKKFATEQPVPVTLFRFFNEFPVLLLIAIVCLVVIKQPA
jgi:putative membrane protein